MGALKAEQLNAALPFCRQEQPVARFKVEGLAGRGVTRHAGRRGRVCHCPQVIVSATPWRT